METACLRKRYSPGHTGNFTEPDRNVCRTIQQKADAPKTLPQGSAAGCGRTGTASPVRLKRRHLVFLPQQRPFPCRPIPIEPVFGFRNADVGLEPKQCQPVTAHPFVAEDWARRSPIMPAAFPAGAIRIATRRLQPGAAMEPRQPGMRRHASAHCPVRKRPDTLILTFAIRIFRSPSLSVKPASGPRVKRRTDSPCFAGRSWRLCAPDFAVRPRLPFGLGGVPGNSFPP